MLSVSGVSQSCITQCAKYVVSPVSHVGSVVLALLSILYRRPPQGRIRGGGGGLRGQDPPFWGTPKFHKEGKTWHACARICLFST